MLLRLALALLRYEWRANVVLTAALTALAAPLLLLWSLKSGVIAHLEQQIIGNPANFEIVIAGNDGGMQLYTALQDDPDVAFMAIKPVSLNAEAVLRAPSSGKFNRRVILMPSGEGDPLLLRSGILPPGRKEIVLSAPLATTLQVQPGDHVLLSVQRIKDGLTRKAEVPFTVTGIINPAFCGQQSACLNQDTLIYLADFKAGNEPPVFTEGGVEPDRSRYAAGIRLYATDLDGVLKLSAKIRSLQREIAGSKVADIVSLKAVDSVLSSIFWVVAAVSAAGGVLACCGLVHLQLHNRSRTMAMLQLLGLNRLELTLFIACKNSCCALAAFVLAWALYEAGAAFINTQFSQALAGAQIAQLPWSAALILGLLLQVLLWLLSAGAMYVNYAGRQTAELLREGA